MFYDLPIDGTPMDINLRDNSFIKGFTLELS